MVSEGVDDSHEDAMAYFEDVVGDVGPASSYERREAYITRGPEMVSFLQGLGLSFRRCEGYSDYYPDAKGGKARGRSIEGTVFDGHRLGPWFEKLQRGLPLRNVGSGRLHGRRGQVDELQPERQVSGCLGSILDPHQVGLCPRSGSHDVGVVVHRPDALRGPRQ